MIMQHYAHSAESVSREKWHLLPAHLKDTAERAAAFLGAVGLADFGRAVGLLHDVGKYAPKFQRRLEGGGRVDHSTAGAKIAIERYGDIPGKMLAFCIAGHHADLANGVNGERTTALADRLQQPDGVDPVWEQQLTLTKPAPRSLKARDKDSAAFCAAFLIRMLFSALVDADFLDTEAYYDKLSNTEKPRGQHPSLSELSRRLSAHLDTLTANAEGGEVNTLRREVLGHAKRRAAEPPGLFTLTVPTGGGKTLTSLAFALEHAVKHGLERVIYVIPYMSIIEQTAAVFRDALRRDDADAGDYIVEHHSTFDEDLITKREAREKLRLAMENWDAPIIVTTAVQFFESLFSNRPSRCRKLHNVANSVIILDEAQTLPLQFLRPCVAAIDELARNWRASIVLCTATQPALGRNDGFRGGFERLRELAPDPTRLYRTLKRTRLRVEGTVDDLHLADRLRAERQVLCIVNTRRHARELYESVSGVDGSCHLTTSMCALHRRETLETVRARLTSGAPVRLVATSLIEAGVDVDFPVVWRAVAGLESIIQAAGRCNREGRAPVGDVFVFEPAAGDGRKPPPDLEQSAAVARSVLRRREDDPTALEAIRGYFQDLYWYAGDGSLDTKDILRKLSECRSSLDFPFETIAKEFRLIETPMVPVIVPYRGSGGNDETAARLVRELEWVERPGRIARRLQPYVVQVPPRARGSLVAANAATVVREPDFDMQFVVLSNLDLYLPDVGLTWDDPTYRAAEGLVV